MIGPWRISEILSITYLNQQSMIYEEKKIVTSSERRSVKYTFLI